MALKLLHGPITCTLNPEEAYLGGDAEVDYGSTVYHDNYGIMFMVPDDTMNLGHSGSAYMNLDGVIYGRAVRGSALARYSLQHDLILNRILAFYHYGTGFVAVWEPLTGSWYSTSVESFPVDGGPFCCRTSTGWWAIDTSYLIRSPLDQDSFSNIYLHGVSKGTNSHISPGQSGTFWCYMDDASGTLIQYDYNKEEEVYPNTTNTNRITLGTSDPERCFYSPKFDIFITLRPTTADPNVTEIHIYGNELVPNALSAPTADPVITQGNVSEISTTLTDDNGVGIPDRRIDWSITAGNGTLLDTQTVTDRDGIATTQYRCPISGGVDPTIQCELTY